MLFCLCGQQYYLHQQFALHVMSINRDSLWENKLVVSLDSLLPLFHHDHRLNKHLREEPLGPELRYAIATRHSMRRRVPVHTRAFVDFNFGAAPVHSGSSVVHLMLENTGDVPAEW